jgi:hypothetical protein
MQASAGACRTRLSAWDRRPRRCVRLLVDSATFPLARALPSPCSAGPLGRPLFAGFLGTLQRSDSLHPYTTVVPRGCTVRTCRSLGRPEAGPPGVRTPCCYACQRSPTPPGPSPPCQNGVDRVAFRVCGARRHPGLARLRGSILCLRVPLSTLRRHRYRCLRMTRGQCGWLDLHCRGLAPFTTVPACPGACPNAKSVSERIWLMSHDMRPNSENVSYILISQALVRQKVARLCYGYNAEQTSHHVRPNTLAAMVRPNPISVRET